MSYRSSSELDGGPPSKRFHEDECPSDYSDEDQNQHEQEMMQHDYELYSQVAYCDMCNAYCTPGKDLCDKCFLIEKEKKTAAAEVAEEKNDDMEFEDLDEDAIGNFCTICNKRCDENREICEICYLEESIQIDMQNEEKKRERKVPQLPRRQTQRESFEVNFECSFEKFVATPQIPLREELLGRTSTGQLEIHHYDQWLTSLESYWEVGKIDSPTGNAGELRVQFHLLLSLAMARFPSVSIPSLIQQKRVYLEDVAMLAMAMKKKEIWIKFTETQRDAVLRRFTILNRRIENCYNLISTQSKDAAQRSSYIGGYSSAASLSNFLAGDMVRLHKSDNRVIGKLLLIRDVLFTLDYRKNTRGEVFQAVYADDARTVFTHSYEPARIRQGHLNAKDIKSLLASLPGTIPLDRDFLKLMAGDRGQITDLNSLARTLEQIPDICIPYLDLNYGFRSFTNGLYDMKADIFYKYGDKSIPSVISGAYITCEFNESLMDEKYVDPSNFASGSWFDVIKENCEGGFLEILQYQFPQAIPGETKPYATYSDPELCMRFICAIIGIIAFYEVGEICSPIERYLAIIGASRTGKTKVCDIIKLIVPNFFQLKSTNGELVFGWEKVLFLFFLDVFVRR